MLHGMMASSDEEGEIVEERVVTSYYFVGSKNELISFSNLPLQWEHNSEKVELAETTYLCGVVQDGYREIFTKVVAWKIDLSYAIPEIYVLPETEHRWMMLQKPRKGYEYIVRSVLVSVNCLHFMKKNSEEESGDALWKHIRRIFGAYEVPPSVNDLVDHIQWIQEIAMKDKDIAQSKILPNLLNGVLGKRRPFHVEGDRPAKKQKSESYIVDDGDIEYYGNLSDSDDDELFDHVCAFCDDGGNILCCEGRCIRSFHPTVESGADSLCESLGYSSEQVDAMPTFLCKNCQYQQHQCFICGRLGSSDKSSGAEVFPCVSATCGHFYHPQCVSKILFPGDENQAQQFQKQIENGDSFTCPAHKCYVCKEVEDKNVTEMQFAVCRRCPKAYHRKCLPWSISFGYDVAKGIHQRAWEGLLAKRVLIYCMDHKINHTILTPRRDHLVFPDVHGKRKERSLEALSERKSKAFGIISDKITMRQLPEETPGGYVNKNEKNLTGMISKTKKPSRMDERPSPWKSGMSVSRLSVKNVAENATTIRERALRTADMKNRILKLMNECNSSSQFKGASDHITSQPFKLHKRITMGKVERSEQAIRAAVRKLEIGGTIEDANAVCEPAILIQLIKWKKRLRVDLAPFIHSMRYTSFRRHFTKVDKLKQVVDRLRWYVQDGDMIVDFSCGSKDFSCLMKEELEKMGRNCNFRNYDLIQPKNDFNFEKRNWMSVRPDELPDGSKLIMGLNPPFGVQSFHANQFINKALIFQPKLLILIVPKETERPDERTTPYKLIWEDKDIMLGKSFYLPGSIDVHGQQMEQWNLWSRPDWAIKHKEIAIEHGHFIDQDQNHPCDGT